MKKIRNHGRGCGDENGRRKSAREVGLPDFGDLGLTVADPADAIHIYPTLSEALRLVAQSFTRDIARLSCCAE
jgi:hypothetical protein